MVTSIKNV